MELIAEEEKRLDEQELSDEELAEEERLISEQLGRLLVDRSTESEPSETPKISHLTSFQSEEENWKKIQEKIDSEQTEEAAPSLAAYRQKKLGLRDRFTTQRGFQYGSLLAAAAVLMMVYFLLPVTQEQSGTDHFTYKGSNSEPSAAKPIPDHLVCDYRVLQRSKADSADVRDARIADDATSYVVELGEPIQVAAKCLVENTYLHAAIISNDKTYQLSLNQKIAANQWNMIPAVKDDRFSLSDGSGRVVLFMTIDHIAKSVTLPSEFTTDLDGEPVVEYREIDLVLEQN